MRALFVASLAACSGASPEVPSIDAATTADAPTADAAHLDPTPTTYRGTCDGSGALAIDFTHFIDLDDEDQLVRLYARGRADLVQMLDINAELGLATGDEADLEDVTRIGDRVFAITSHGRKASGSLDRTRYKLGAFTLGGAPPAITLDGAGTSSQLLDQILVSGNWDAPDATVIAALNTASKLGDNNDGDLAPELHGTNIEGLAHDATGRLLIGFRNPPVNGKAIVLAITNPDAALTGTARVAGAALLDLGGLTVRGMAYSEAHHAVLIIGGSIASGGPFKLFTWTGALADQPVEVATITPPANSAPEAIVPYPGTLDVQIVFDQGDVIIGNTTCPNAPATDRAFRDLILSVP